MYKNIEIRNALDCVPWSQYFSVSKEGNLQPPQWNKKKKVKEKDWVKNSKKMFKSTLISSPSPQGYFNYHSKVRWHIL